ncbi:MAG: glutathione S-transferase protein [Betaproteobacteria bacterium]|nr:glutathione S-transferase protein [Betaproteobacteria bacterium]
MLTLYFCPGACSTASHIGLEEAGAQYVEKPIMLPKGEQKTDAYLKINPRGKVPALDVDGKILTENTAILAYIAKAFPDKKLMPADPFEAARGISTMAWFSNIVHPSYTHYMRPERFAADAVAQPSVKETGKKTFWTHLQEIDGLLAGQDFIMGKDFSVVDGYALVFYGWGLRAELPMKELANYTAFKDRMLQRPAVKKVLVSEDSVLIK